MWNLGKLAEETFCKPSSYFPDLDEWTAYQLDRAVTTFCGIVKGALYERITMGNQSVPLYNINQLLEPNFRLPKEGEGITLTTPLTRTEGVIFDEVK